MIDLKPACGRMIDLLAAVSDDQLTSPTPCANYTLGALIDHVDEAAVGFAVLGRKEGGEQPGPDAGADSATHHGAVGRETVAEHVRVLGEAWDDPAAWYGGTATAGFELSNEVWGRIALTEMVVHSWDIARSLDRPVHLPEETLRVCLDHVTTFLPNAPVPELWGPAVAVPPDAPLLDHIVAATGRTP
ncbi:TIGR03086 family metal-binding protein [Streptomyces tsukubensis]|uniref:TIGR03086 family protein n=1 Tax=Streptomyces tsukubensis TaxID=83656 RepID=A0A1V4AFG4_9ACTN|nr:TIGR03086 family metal-binding protein [Streptomyces tsukubensis]OON82779.1 TIGR03086 family protein [Streptomyces tsukubensis]QFR92045.1 TIGR03086 family protein [Streptomyces tsukubensis]